MAIYAPLSPFAFPSSDLYQTVHLYHFLKYTYQYWLPLLHLNAALPITLAAAGVYGGDANRLLIPLVLFTPVYSPLLPSGRFIMILVSFPWAHFIRLQGNHSESRELTRK